MKKLNSYLLLGAMIFCLSTLLTSCEDLFGEWSKPVVVQTPPSTVVAEAKVLGAALEAGATVSISYTVGSTTYVATFVKNADDSYTLQSNVKPSATRALTRTAADPVVSVGTGAAVGDQVQLVLVGGKLKLVVKAANDNPLFEATMDIETGQIAIFNTNAQGINCGIGSFAVNGSPMAIKNPEMQQVTVQFTQPMQVPGSSPIIELSLVFNYTVQYLNGETWADVIARYKASDHGEISTTDDGFISITFRQDIALEVVKAAVSQLNYDVAVSVTPDKIEEMATTVSQTKYYLYTTVPVKSTDVVDGSQQDYGLTPFTYKKGAWDGTAKKVVFTNELAVRPTVVQDASANVTWSDGWYTVSGNVTITGDVFLGADTHLILQDGAKLTINGSIRTSSSHIYIYGQAEGTGKLNVTNSSGTAILGPDSRIMEIHGGEITAESNDDGISNGGINMYGGKLTVTSSTSSGEAIKFYTYGINVYGGELVAEATNTGSSEHAVGIQGSGVLTVYGGKVHAAGNGVIHDAHYGQAIDATIKSGTEGIKFYFSDDNTSWNAGTYYSTSTAAPAIRYAKVE